MAAEPWAGAEAYEAYVGRWSRQIARAFLPWLEMPRDARWLDVGCGTGALTGLVLESADPEEVAGVDPSPVFVDHARAQVRDPRAAFSVAGAEQLPFDDGAFDAVVSGLVLNFVPDATAGAAEMTRVVRPGGVVAAYVWDYADGMQLMRAFWDAAVALDPAARAADEGRRFPLCRPQPLAELLTAAGLREVETRAVEVPTRFADFDDYWRPFLAGNAPAPAYAQSLDDERRTRLRERIRANLPAGPDGSISLTARAWAVRGVR